MSQPGDNQQNSNDSSNDDNTVDGVDFKDVTQTTKK